MFVVDAAHRREDLTVQVKIAPNGPWHRKIVSGTHTGCGEAFNGAQVRDDQYMGDMCKAGCFSAFELGLIPSSPLAPDRANASATVTALRERAVTNAERRDAARRDTGQVTPLPKPKPKTK
jgi:hypothetical protein